MIEARVHDEWCPLTEWGDRDDEWLLAMVMTRFAVDVSHPTLGDVAIFPQRYAWRRAL